MDLGDFSWEPLSLNDLDLLMCEADFRGPKGLEAQLKVQFPGAVMRRSSLLDNALTGAPTDAISCTIEGLKLQISLLPPNSGSSGGDGGGGGGGVPADKFRGALFSSTSAYSAVFTANSLYELQPSVPPHRRLLSPCLAPGAFSLRLFALDRSDADSLSKPMALCGGHDPSSAPWRAAHLLAAWAVLTGRLKLPLLPAAVVEAADTAAQAALRKEKYQVYFSEGVGALAAAAAAAAALFCLRAGTPSALDVFCIQHKCPSSARAAARRLYWLLCKTPKLPDAPPEYWESVLIAALLEPLSHEMRAAWEETGAVAYMRACTSGKLPELQNLTEISAAASAAALCAKQAIAEAYRIHTLSSKDAVSLGAGIKRGREEEREEHIPPHIPPPSPVGAGGGGGNGVVEDSQKTQLSTGSQLP